jgi:Rad3-related DNA helicase
MTDIMTNFPLAKPRASQEAVIREIEAAYKDNYKYVVLCAPVGSGKSAIAMTIAKWIGGGRTHILTPRKSLQDQYFDDFGKDLVLMKGRASYYCTKDDDSGGFHEKVIKWILSGSCPAPTREFTTCGPDAPCKGKIKIANICTTARGRECPYNVAIDLAESEEIIVHNFHSFLFQYHFALRFNHRRMLIIDEAHEVEGILRSFSTTKTQVYKIIEPDSLPDFTQTKLEYWIQYLSQDFLRPRSQKRKEAYETALDSLAEQARQNKGDFIVKFSEEPTSRVTTFEFIPTYVGNTANALLFSCADKVLLMSGTIYNKDIYCKSLGIDPSEAYFIRIGSSFPVSSRPIYCKKDYLVDTSHAKWNENKEQITSIIKTILAKFDDVKGLIHVPSYKAAREIVDWVKDKRLHMHESENFTHELEKFYESKGNGVFISPACQQGVDFKGDRARFQIILRVPYLNTGDKFVEHKVKNDFPWYNHQALVTFGQQTGRINRSEEDFGVTILLDERFLKFLSRNKSVLPKWLKDSIKY